MLFICRIKPESEEKSASTGKLFQMLTVMLNVNVTSLLNIEFESPLLVRYYVNKVLKSAKSA